MSLDLYFYYGMPDEVEAAAAADLLEERGVCERVAQHLRRLAVREHCNERLRDFNITHNLGKMASEAGIYDCLWVPEENGITTAGQMVQPLEAGLAVMRQDPDRFRALNASNGWGTYDQFIPWIEEVLEFCRENPTALVDASR